MIRKPVDLHRTQTVSLTQRKKVSVKDTASVVAPENKRNDALPRDIKESDIDLKADACYPVLCMPTRTYITNLSLDQIFK